MNALKDHLALHTWTLDSTPLDLVLTVARDAGYRGVELRHADFVRWGQAGREFQELLHRVRDSGLVVSQVGTENGMLFAAGAERLRLLASLRGICEKAVALDCAVVMMPPGPVASGVELGPEENLAACADLAAEYGLQLAFEFNSRHPTVNTVGTGLALIEAINRDNCGLLIDTYHLYRGGGSVSCLSDLAAERVISVQLSDVPAGPDPNQPVPIDRLPPGLGIVAFVDIFKALLAMGYQGFLSYEAPNPLQWCRPPATVARQGLDVVKALLAVAQGLEPSQDSTNRR